MDQTIRSVLGLLRRALFAQTVPLAEGVDIAAVYEEMRLQSVAELANNELIEACPDMQLRRTWAKTILSQLSQNAYILRQQDKLLSLLSEAGISAVILKGAAACQYYPVPENRAMGDVDVLVRQEDYAAARALMETSGFHQTHPEQPGDCLISFEKNGVEFELHRRLRWDADSALEHTLNHFIADGMKRMEYRSICGYSIPVLPDWENGLVLLWHLRRHMDSGLGLRQILDWMLYVDRFLDDSQWENGFRQAAKDCGLEKLAVITAGMCQRHLGLTASNRNWCASADREAGDVLLQFAFDGGTFGCKQEAVSHSAVISMVQVPGIVGRLRRMQAYGLLRWKAAGSHRFLRPFAWLYQLVYYIEKSMDRPEPLTSLWKDWRKSRQMRKLIRTLEIRPLGGNNDG